MSSLYQGGQFRNDIRKWRIKVHEYLEMIIILIINLHGNILIYSIQFLLYKNADELGQNLLMRVGEQERRRESVCEICLKFDSNLDVEMNRNL